jgi:hypothetical protein
MEEMKRKMAKREEAAKKKAEAAAGKKGAGGLVRSPIFFFFGFVLEKYIVLFLGLVKVEKRKSDYCNRWMTS